MKYQTLLFSILFIVNIEAYCQSSTAFTIVVLGSSTSEGAGASSPGKSWVGLYNAALKKLNRDFKVYNLAKSGYSTMHLCPNHYTFPGQIVLPDTNANITRALSLNPDAIIINLPANDLVLKIPLERQKKNFDVIINTALQDSVPIWVTTVQPRNGLTEKELQYQLEMKSWILSRYGDKAIDLWSGLANNEGGLKSEYAYRDGAHLNDKGHALLFNIINNKNIPQQLEDALIKINAIDTVSLAKGWEFRMETGHERGLSKFILERNDASWIKIESVTANGNSNMPKRYVFKDTSSFTSEKYYRIGIANTKKKGTTITYSPIILVGAFGNKYTLYPNPSNDIFWIRGLSLRPHVLKIFNVSGKLIYKDESYLAYNHIATTNWPTGIYFVCLDNAKTYLRLVKN